MDLPPTGSNVESLKFIEEALGVASAIRAAYELGVISRLDLGPADLSTITQECAIDRRGARILLGALASLGVVEVTENGTFSATFPKLGFMAGMMAAWSGMTDIVRNARPLVAGDTVAGASSLYPSLVPFLGAMFAPAAKVAAEKLATPGGRVLDVGAGAAPWSLAIASREPSCTVTAVDLPEVLAATRNAVTAAGKGSQFDYLAGDVFSIELETCGYDLAIAGNVCHLFDENANRTLLRNLFAALRPGGKIAIVDIIPNEQLDGPRSVMLYALGLLGRTSRGQVYPFSAFAGWLREAGFESIERCDLSANTPISLISARRPRQSGE